MTSGALYLKSGGIINLGAASETVFTMGVNNNAYGFFNNSGGTLSTSRVTFGNQSQPIQTALAIDLMSAGLIIFHRILHSLPLKRWHG